MKQLLQLFFLFQIQFVFCQQSVDSIDYQDLLKLNPSSTFSSIANKLNRIKERQTKEPFTVLHFGDSHIQGDFFSGEVRSLLQSEFGHAGQGIIFPYSLCKSYGPKGVKVTSKGTWTGTNILKNTERMNVGVAGYTLYTANANSELSFEITDKFTGKVSNRITIWTSADSNTIEYKLNDGIRLVGESLIAPNLNVRTYESDSLISFFNLSLIKSTNAGSKFYFHGFEYEFEEVSGINYHHLGVVGAQFTHLIYNADLAQKQIQQLKPDLVIFSFGTNEAYDQKVDTNFYYSSISKFIESTKAIVPNVEFLLTTAPDTRSQGRIPPNQQTVNRQIVRLADNLDLSLFDLNQAMGGWGSLKRWYDNKLTLTDKLHFNVQGYKLQGKMLSFAILNEYNRFSSNPNKVDMLKLTDDLQVGLNPILIQEINTSSDSLIVNKEPESKTVVINKTKPKTVSYTVKSGDTISEIARKHKVSIQKILVVNRMKESSIIRPGQKLVIPKS